MIAQELIRRIIRGSPFHSLSIGIAGATRDMENVTDWLQAADTALYQAKRGGKNRIYAH
uniref:diguanylate cyclase domain-containing protein n=1 Tax=Lelliottia sp. T2.26D-8 TaxID=3041165 RepID=UPI0025400AD5|nr:diguanylate cyclase [Lelliottia sp. T2.26D-8]